MDRLAAAEAIAKGKVDECWIGVGWHIPLISGFLLVAIELVSLLKTAIERDQEKNP